jgi:hypothetical protein
LLAWVIVRQLDAFPSHGDIAERGGQWTFNGVPTPVEVRTDRLPAP